MARTYEPIASTTLGSDSANIEFTAIPGTFTDLIVVLHGYTSETSANDMKMQFNSDTGSNYSYTQLYGNGSSALSNRASNAAFIRSGSTATASTALWLATMQIMSYANANVFKTCLGSDGQAGSLVVRNVGLWRSTSAITSIKFTTASALNLKAGFTASLYGVKAA